MVSIKLDSSNYLLWKLIIVPILKGTRLDGYAFGTKSCPPQFLNESDEANPAFEDWTLKDQMLIAMLINSLSNEISSQMYGSSSSQQLWKEIERQCGSHSKAQAAVYKTSLQTARKDNQSMKDYL
ncbi:hypothetical protein Sjap_023868 [Stephania japonica]|uniref:Retrotransposon Copia-like N-terminal domain-containing protein n=1 Tax=Stephania japonica TaxID=461633 RepID=A0AAP0HNE0_9MAGN